MFQMYHSKKGVGMKKMLVVVAVLCLFSVPNVMAQGEPCTHDTNCDQNVDATDVDTFLAQFGRNPYHQNPCPDCYDSPCPCTPAPVEKTGQTTCYDTTGTVISCTHTGQDGDLQKGVTWPNPRFNDRGNGTVVDNLTGLTWLKDANCFGTRTWSNALSDSNGLADGSCGLTDGSNAGDWRLPNRFELESLLNLEYFNPAIPNTAGTGQWSMGDAFTNVHSYYYWSSTANASISGYAWGVFMDAGSVVSGGNTADGYVWPVRDPL